MWKTLFAVAIGVVVSGAADVAVARPALAPRVPATTLVGPDYWIAIGRERDLQFSRTEYVRQVALDVGNNGSAGQQQQLVTLVVSVGGRDLCSTSKAIAPPASRRGTPVVALQVVYSVPIDSLPQNRKVTYGIVGTILPAADDAPNEDQNAANNRTEVNLQFPVGGKVRCVQL